MTVIHTPYGDLRVRPAHEPASLDWRLDTDMPGLVINDRRIALDATHDLTDIITFKVWDYAYVKRTNSASGTRMGPVDDPDVLDVVCRLLDQVAARMRVLLNATATPVTEVVVDGLASERAADLTRSMLMHELGKSDATPEVTRRGKQVLVQGAAEDEQRVVAALLAACVPASVFARQAVLVSTVPLPPEMSVDDVTRKRQS